MLRSIEAGETFIVWDDDGTPAATITINRFAKPELWTEQERAEGLRDAGLAVGRPAPACPSVEVAVRSFSTPSRPALRAASGRPPARQRHDDHRALASPSPTGRAKVVAAASLVLHCHACAGSCVTSRSRCSGPCSLP
jgi:hypothetical protein